jgi:hypothetical protein
LEFKNMYLNAAARLLSELRQFALALQEYRRRQPAPRRSSVASRSARHTAAPPGPTAPSVPVEGQPGTPTVSQGQGAPVACSAVPPTDSDGGIGRATKRATASTTRKRHG